MVADLDSRLAHLDADNAISESMDYHSDRLRFSQLEFARNGVPHHKLGERGAKDKDEIRNVSYFFRRNYFFNSAMGRDIAVVYEGLEFTLGRARITPNLV